MAHLIKLILLGDSGKGKTSIVQRYTTYRYNEESKTTFTPKIFSKEHGLQNGQKMQVLLWDTPKIEKYTGLSLEYCIEASAAILVYNITQIQSLSSIKFWICHIKTNKPNTPNSNRSK